MKEKIKIGGYLVLWIITMICYTLISFILNGKIILSGYVLSLILSTIIYTLLKAIERGKWTKSKKLNKK